MADRALNRDARSTFLQRYDVFFQCSLCIPSGHLLNQKSARELLVSGHLRCRAFRQLSVSECCSGSWFFFSESIPIQRSALHEVQLCCCLLLLSTTLFSEDC